MPDKMEPTSVFGNDGKCGNAVERYVNGNSKTTENGEDVIKNSKLTYDKEFKRLFTTKKFLTPILKNIVPEYKGYPLEQIESFITPRGDVTVNPAVYSPEDSGKGNEMTAYYDVLIDCALPDNEKVCVDLFLDLEMQRESRPKYSIPKRGVYYCCRLISRQLDVLDQDEAYDRLKPVYSVWILVNDIPQELKNSIYSMDLSGSFHDKKLDGSARAAKLNREADLIHLRLVYLSEDFNIQKEQSDLIKYLQSVDNKERLMNILNFEKKHVKEAMEIALANYNDERQYVKELPQVCDIPDLYGFAENGLGVAAFENEKMIGFLCCCEPFDNAFRATDVRGIFSPMGANAAVTKNRSQIYAAMYQAAGEKWIKTGAVSHAICLYAHDEELQQQFFRYGFGLRCLDAIRPMELIHCEFCAGYDLVELPEAEYHFIYPLHLALYQHYRESPFFMNREPETQEEFVVSSMQEGARYFAAKQNGKICAFVKISVPGETFVAMGDTYRHIRGAYCLPEHRGKGLYQNLLNFTISVLKREGYTKLGVDFESFNPTARGFWLKYFTAYTNSVVRRIDERIIHLRL